MVFYSTEFLPTPNLIPIQGVPPVLQNIYDSKLIIFNNVTVSETSNKS